MEEVYAFGCKNPLCPEVAFVYLYGSGYDRMTWYLIDSRSLRKIVYVDIEQSVFKAAREYYAKLDDGFVPMSREEIAAKSGVLIGNDIHLGDIPSRIFIDLWAKSGQKGSYPKHKTFHHAGV